MTAALPSPPGTPDLPRRILDLLGALLRASPTGADAALSSTLARLAALFGVDRAAVVRPGSDPSGPDLPACWSSDGVAPAGIGLSGSFAGGGEFLQGFGRSALRSVRMSPVRAVCRGLDF